MLQDYVKNITFYLLAHKDKKFFHYLYKFLYHIHMMYLI